MGRRSSRIRGGRRSSLHCVPKGMFWTSKKRSGSGLAMDAETIQRASSNTGTARPASITSASSASKPRFEYGVHSARSLQPCCDFHDCVLSLRCGKQY
eukprot:2375975-Rhodomonas_salina.5